MIVILGGGFGGLATARELRRLVRDEIIVIDKKDKFSVGMANLWLMSGERDKPIEKELSKLEEQGIRFLNEKVISIDAKNKIITTDNRELHADYIVIAAGVEMDLDAIEGFREGALNLYDSNDAIEINKRLEDFEGKIIVLIASIPFKCPPAPYEAVLLLNSYFRKLGRRDKVEISLYTPESRPVPLAGDYVSKVIEDMLNKRNIEYNSNMSIKRINAEKKKILFDKWIEYDLLIGIPVHKAPRFLNTIDPSGWININPKTLETRYKDVYAIGDVTIIKRDSITLPKAGTFAEREGVVVANNIAYKINNKDDRVEYDGYGYCYVDIGDGKAALTKGYFYEEPPRVELEEASEYYKRKMLEFEKERLEML